MLHGFTRVAARLFGGQFGQVPPDHVSPIQESVQVGTRHHPLLRWQDPGNGAVPVVLMHGLQDSPWTWARTAQVLARHRGVFAPAQRGHGVDDAPESGYELAQTTADLLEVLDRLALPQCHLVGHSWGGKVVLHFAAHHPQRIASLALADPVPARGLNPLLQRFPGLIQAAFAPERASYADNDALHAARQTLVYLANDDETDRRLWQEKFKRTEDGRYIPRLPARAFDELFEETFAEDISPLAGQVPCPVLFMRPVFTVSFWPGEVRQQIRAFPNAQLTRIPGDHTFIHSNALDTANALQSFWGRLGL